MRLLANLILLATGIFIIMLPTIVIVPLCRPFVVQLVEDRPWMRLPLVLILVVLGFVLLTFVMYVIGRIIFPRLYVKRADLDDVNSMGQ
jgi:hypothetical protein